MDNNFNSFNPVSGADSASVQEQLVKGSLSSSNFNIVDELEEVDLDFHKYDYRSGHPAVFVCTYHKYAENRPLAGMWLDLYTFSCYEDFVAACRWLHRDEQDPEFAYLDYENYPDEWYSESGLDEDTFERILEYADLDDDEQEAFRAFLDVTSDSDADFSDFRERYCGRWDSEEEFAQRLADELCMFDNVPESITRFFDYCLLRSRLGIVRTSSALLSLFPQVTSRLLPESCSCQTMTWAMAVTCSASAKPQRTQRERATAGGFFFAIAERDEEQSLSIHSQKRPPFHSWSFCLQLNRDHRRIVFTFMRIVPHHKAQRQLWLAMRLD